VTVHRGTRVSRWSKEDQIEKLRQQSKKTNKKHWFAMSWSSDYKLIERKSQCSFFLPSEFPCLRGTQQGWDQYAREERELAGETQGTTFDE
jgi:hypothetical protein